MVHSKRGAVGSGKGSDGIPQEVSSWHLLLQGHTVGKFVRPKE
jgi:hypothetical protein